MTPPHDGSEATESLLEVGRAAPDGVRRAGIRRLVVVGGLALVAERLAVRSTPWPTRFPERGGPVRTAQAVSTYAWTPGGAP